MTWWQLTMALLCTFGFGLLWGVDLGRLIERLRRRRRFTARHYIAPNDLPLPADGGINVPRLVVRAEIKMYGQVVRTDMVISSDVLEQLANGVGKTLTPLPSTEVH